ncbi:MAG: hypothetical protein Q9183_000518 [Haloplaca sp. 2 TL-2023]
MKRKREKQEDDAAKSMKHARSSNQRISEITGSHLKAAPSIDDAIGKMDNRLLADYVAQRSKRFGQHLSLVELEDMHIPEAAILDSSEWSGERRLQSLPDFLLAFVQRGTASNNLESASKRPGEPHTLIITAAGLRAAELTRVLRQFQTKEATVAKLFAKHIKLKDATAFVKATRMNFGVGTPTRIVDLLDNGALALESLQRIVIDCSFLDPKKRNIFDMKETQQPLMQLLNRPGLKERYSSSSSAPVKLIFY